MAIWKPFRLIDVVNDISEERFVLPVIQRRLVWDEEKMELLFDTLLRGDSFGGIMVIEEEKSTKPLFNYRPFTKDGESIPSRQVDGLNQTQNFVIDGQQRLQSFYIGLKGSINGKVLYFDLFSDYLSEFQFKFENKSDDLPKSSRENNERPISEHKWFRASELLQRLKETNDEDQVAEEVCSTYNINDKTQQMHVQKNCKAFYKNIISSETVGVSKVIINKSLDEAINKQRIVELFRRLNDGGTKLSSFDLVASILKGFAWEMESFLDKTLEDYHDIGLSQDNLIKLIFILQDNHRKEMSSIESTDAEFALTNRNRISATLKSLKSYLHHSKLYDFYREGNRSFIPLFFIAYHLFHKDIDDQSVEYYFDNFDTGNADFPKINKWLFNSLLNGVFKSKGAGWIPYKTGIRKLLVVFINHKNSIFPDEIIFNVYKEHPITFSMEYSVEHLDKLDYPFLYYIIYDKSLSIRSQDIDHIMPKSLLESLNYESSMINSIKNFQLIDSGTNRGEKNGKPFEQWLNNPSYVSDKASYLRKHLIPNKESLWMEDQFIPFIEERGKLIHEKIIKNM